MSTGLRNIRPVVTLTTDFGEGSPYVAQMKGVLLTRNPDLQIIDITHDIAPQDVHGGSIVLSDVCFRFPPRTIHIAVVDPGVGTDRCIVYVKCGEQQFIAPDNGLLTHVVRGSRPTIIRAVTNRLYFLPTVSATFHGRDILAPVAAHLSLGLKPPRLGPTLDSLEMLQPAEPIIEARRIVGTVIQIDSFGNLITNISAKHFPENQPVTAIRVRCRKCEVTGLVQTYANRARGTFTALFGSGGRLELAVVHGNASAVVGAKLNDEVVASW